MLKINIRKLKIFVLVIGILFICSVVTFSAFTLYAYTSNNNVPVFSDIVERLENVFVNKETFNNLLVQDFETYLTNPTMDIPYSGMSADVSFGGDLESQGMEISMGGTGTITYDVENMDVSMDTDFDMDVAGIQLSMGMDLKAFIDTDKMELFMRLRDMPSIFAMTVPQLDQVFDKWIYYGITFEEYGSILGDGGISIENGQISIDPELKEQFIQFATSEELLDSITRLPDRVVGNIRTYCIGMDFGEKQFERLMEMYEEMGIEIGELEPGLSMNLEYCAGRRDGLPYYVSTTNRSDGMETQYVFDNFTYSSDPVEIEKPEEYVDLEDLEDLGFEISTEV